MSATGTCIFWNISVKIEQFFLEMSTHKQFNTGLGFMQLLYKNLHIQKLFGLMMATAIL